MQRECDVPLSRIVQDRPDLRSDSAESDSDAETQSEVGGARMYKLTVRSPVVEEFIENFDEDLYRADPHSLVLFFNAL